MVYSSSFTTPTCQRQVTSPQGEALESIASFNKNNGERINTKIIADNKLALEEAKNYLEKNNYKVFIYPTPLTIEATNSAKELFNYIKKISNEHKAPFAVIAGGEPVVTFKNNLLECEINKKTNGLPRLRLAMTEGIGGRAQELALSMLKNINEISSRKILFLAAGSDGIDGPTDAAGALVSNFNPNKISNNNKIDEYLLCHNSYNYFKNYGGLIKTGYTGTNVNDIFIALVI
jgi:glycerate-2-kinase